MQLYLDIDGVLLTKHGNLAEGAVAFLQWAIVKHQPYWISTRTRDGSHQGAFRAFYNKIGADIIRAIHPLQWNVLKTEVLPFQSRDWVWIDDAPLHAENGILADNRASDRLVLVNLDHNPWALIELPKTLI